MNIYRLYIMVGFILMLLTPTSVCRAVTTDFEFRRWKKNTKESHDLTAGFQFRRWKKNSKGIPGVVDEAKKEGDGSTVTGDDDELVAFGLLGDEAKDKANSTSGGGATKKEERALFINTILTRENFEELKKEKLSKASVDNPFQMQDQTVSEHFNAERTLSKEHLKSVLMYNLTKNKLENNRDGIEQKIMNKLERLSFMKKLKSFTYDDLLKWMDKKIQREKGRLGITLKKN